MDVLLNWLAHGLVLAMAVAAGLRAIPFSRTQARYRFVWAGYLSLLVLPALAPVLTSILCDDANRDATVVASMSRATLPDGWRTSSSAIGGLWAAWFGMHVVAFGVASSGARRARRRGRDCPDELLARLPHWSRMRATGRPARVVLSNDVRTAGVLGCGRPVIAIAPAAIDRLDDADLDRVLVHELAHVRRRDDLAQGVQVLVRAIAGWHPAAWWFDRQLTFEREVACDEIVVRATGSAKQYARCLVDLAALASVQERSAAQLAAASRSRLRARVDRILAGASTAPGRSRRLLATASAVVLLACATVASTVRIVTYSQPSPFLTAVALDEPRAAEVRMPGAAPSSPAVSATIAKPHADREQRVSARPAKRTGRLSRAADDTHVARQPITTPIALSVRSLDDRAGALTLLPMARPSSAALESLAPIDTADALATESRGWMGAADAGVAIGRASRDAGVATAGFFRRFGVRVAASF